MFLFSCKVLALRDYVHYLVCDQDVVVVALENGSVLCYKADTLELLYVSIF